MPHIADHAIQAREMPALQGTAGAWRVETVSGGNEIAGVRTANGLAQPKVEARVLKRRGRKRVLRYRIRKIPGQRVIFLEQGNGAARRLGTVRGGRGRLVFNSADGPRGRRLILATVLNGEVPRQSSSVAVYEAPRPIRPGKPRKLRVKRRDSKLVVSWRKARHAKRYAVSIVLRDGRRLSELTKKRKLVVKPVPGIVGAKVKVAGLKADNTPGESARAKLKPKPKKRKKKRQR
jgi:hypothetical protein